MTSGGCLEAWLIAPSTAVYRKSHASRRSPVQVAVLFPVLLPLSYCRKKLNRGHKAKPSTIQLLITLQCAKMEGPGQVKFLGYWTVRRYLPEVPSAWHLSKATAWHDTDTFLSQEFETVVHVQLHCGIFFLHTYKREQHVTQDL